MNTVPAPAVAWTRAWLIRTLSGRVVEHPADGSPSAGSIPGGWFGNCRLSRSIHLEPLFYSTVVQILLTTNC